MSRKVWVGLGIAAGLVVVVVGLIGLTLYYDNLPETLSQHETIVLGQSQLVPGSTAAMRVVVRDSRDAAHCPTPKSRCGCARRTVGARRYSSRATTDASGNVDVAFAVPDDVDPNQTLIVETKSALGSDTLEQAVTVERDFRILLTTDKPLYQPGQMIHIRALALGAFDLRPAAGQSLEVTVADGKGNTVFRKTLTTSDFGVAAVDFQLASEVNTGPYKLTATLGNTSSEKTVTVEHYVLPKFDVQPHHRPHLLPPRRPRGRLADGALLLRQGRGRRRGEARRLHLRLRARGRGDVGRHDGRRGHVSRSASTCRTTSRAASWRAAARASTSRPPSPTRRSTPKSGVCRCRWRRARSSSTRCSKAGSRAPASKTSST